MVKEINDSGFRKEIKEGATRIINKDGTSNIRHINRRLKVDDLYSHLINISWLHFFGYVLLGYILINTLFGVIYLMVGIEQITPKTGNIFSDFLNGFFFSAQTVTTVGYGGISPHGILANIISSFEALIGLLSFSFITGLLYGRFSKPKSAINFSSTIVLRDFKENSALMFRLMNNRKNIMIEPEIHVTLSLSTKDDNDQYKRQFYNLKLERNKIMYLPTMWTVVHEIDSESPLFKYSKKEIKELDAEIYILAKYHEESFSQKVYQMHTYNFDEISINKKFVTTYEFDVSGTTMLNHKQLNEIEAV